jgi:hypothetical protein
VDEHQDGQNHEEPKHDPDEVAGPCVKKRFHDSLYLVSFRLRPESARPRVATISAAISRAR